MWVASVMHSTAPARSRSLLRRRRLRANLQPASGWPGWQPLSQSDAIRYQPLAAAAAMGNADTGAHKCRKGLRPPPPCCSAALQQAERPLLAPLTCR